MPPVPDTAKRRNIMLRLEGLMPTLGSVEPGACIWRLDCNGEITLREVEPCCEDLYGGAPVCSASVLQRLRVRTGSADLTLMTI